MKATSLDPTENAPTANARPIFCSPGGWRARGRGSRGAGLVLALVVVGGLASGQGQTLYRLVAGSEWTPGGEGPSLALRGVFRLVPQPGLLDWEQFAVDRLHFETVSEGGAPRVWRGSGFYRRGGRGPFFGQEILRLEMDDGSGPVRYVSTLRPAGADIELTLEAKEGGAALRLKAVPAWSQWLYRTVAESRFVNACIVCAGRVIPVPVSGGFELVHSGGTPLFERYQVFGLRLTDGAEPPGVVITGEGTVELGGEVAVQQRWELTLRVRLGEEERTATFRNTDVVPVRWWPMLSAELAEEGGDEFSRFHLSLQAAPFREWWFTTRSGMTPGTGPRPTGRLTGADLLSDTGRVVVPGMQLLQPAGLPAETGVDGFDLLPGGAGEVAFTLGESADSPVLGRVSEGDLLSSAGRVLRRNAELVGALGFMPPTPDLGLDAICLHGSGEYWFSVRTPAFSEKLGRMIGRGDLLSSVGRVVRSHTELLGAFKPDNPDRDYGLDAFFVWPSGEIWFSLEEGFTDSRWGPVGEGDLLSDQGYVVRRNLDLVRPFQPLEDLADFGLDGIWIVSDAVPPAGAPRLLQPVRGAEGWELRWDGPVRVVQVEHSSRIEDPFAVASLLLPAGAWKLPAVGPSGPEGFYRLRAW